MKFKANDWLDTKTHEVHYGIDGFQDGQWYHIASEGKPLFFDNAKDRDERIKLLRERAKELGK